MSDREDVQLLLERLQSHRATLAHYLNQQALHGKSMAPPVINQGILEARRGIQTIKEFLQQRGITIEHYLDDEDDTKIRPFPVASQQRNNNLAEIAREICILADNFSIEARRIRWGISTVDEQSRIREGETIIEFRHSVAENILQRLSEAVRKAKFVLPCGKEVDEQVGILFQLFGEYSSSILVYLQLNKLNTEYNKVGLFSPPAIEQPRLELIDNIFNSGGDRFTTAIEEAVEAITQMLQQYLFD